MDKEVLAVLGSPNSPSGELSIISTSRLDTCLEAFSKEKLILCTGGWGPHFNTSAHPHASYAKTYLIEKGLPKEAFLPSALSTNTVDDAVKMKPILSQFNHVRLMVITSNYHVERVKLIFSTILKAYPMTFVGVDSRLEKDQYDRLVQHEKKAIQSIQENGLYY